MISAHPSHEVLLSIVMYYRSMKQWLRPGCQPSPMAVSMKDLLEANSKGRWWLVGSAWAGGMSNLQNNFSVRNTL